MKKPITYTFLALIISLSSCTLKDVITPEIIIKSTTGTGTETGTGTGTDTGTGTSASTSYQPLTQGSTLTYKTTAYGGATDNITITINGNHKTFDGNNFAEYTVTSSTYGSMSNGYYYNGNNLYLNRDASIAPDMSVPYLKDNAAVNDTWIQAIDLGPSPITARLLGTLKEKDITRTVNGKPFTNVYHTTVEYQLSGGSVYATNNSYDYYIAKGVGIIEVTSQAYGTVTYTQTIMSYDIK